MIFAIILGPRDIRKLPLEDYISQANFLRGEQTPLGVDLKNEKKKMTTLWHHLRTIDGFDKFNTCTKARLGIPFNHSKIYPRRASWVLLSWGRLWQHHSMSLGKLVCEKYLLVDWYTLLCIVQFQRMAELSLRKWRKELFPDLNLLVWDLYIGNASILLSPQTLMGWILNHLNWSFDIRNRSRLF